MIFLSFDLDKKNNNNRLIPVMNRSNLSMCYPFNPLVSHSIN